MLQQEFHYFGIYYVVLGRHSADLLFHQEFRRFGIDYDVLGRHSADLLFHQEFRFKEDLLK